MPFLKHCGACRKKKFYITKRVYNAKHVGRVESQSELCRLCFKKISKML